MLVFGDVYADGRMVAITRFNDLDLQVLLYQKNDVEVILVAQEGLGLVKGVRDREAKDNPERKYPKVLGVSCIAETFPLVFPNDYKAWIEG